MRQFKITDPHPERPWRRHKHYTFGELRWLAKRNHWSVRRHKKRIEVAEPSGRVIANFAELTEVPLIQRSKQETERLAAFAALRA